MKNIESEYKVGRFYVNELEVIYQIVYDVDRGYVLLNMREGIFESRFYETIDMLVNYTGIDRMKSLKGEVVANFTPRVKVESRNKMTYEDVWIDQKEWLFKMIKHLSDSLDRSDGQQEKKRIESKLSGFFIAHDRMVKTEKLYEL